MWTERRIKNEKNFEASNRRNIIGEKKTLTHKNRHRRKIKYTASEWVSERDRAKDEFDVSKCTIKYILKMCINWYTTNTR